MLLEFLRWWYGPGWAATWARISLSITKVRDGFAIPVLLRSLFSPWKQITSAGGRSIDEKFHAGVDNTISRTIGFFVRVGTLIVALVVVVISATLSLVRAVAWPLLPIAFVYCVVRVVVG